MRPETVQTHKAARSIPITEPQRLGDDTVSAAAFHDLVAAGAKAALIEGEKWRRV
jgi:hypothetical protein